MVRNLREPIIVHRWMARLSRPCHPERSRLSGGAKDPAHATPYSYCEIRLLAAKRTGFGVTPLETGVDFEPLPSEGVLDYPSAFSGHWTAVSSIWGIPMAEQLADKFCAPCRGGVPPLTGKELKQFHDQLPKWKVVNEHHLQREYRFPDFKQALDFVNRVGAVAEEQGHHPDILLSWGKAEVTLWTHKVDGLTESDFIMAAKIDRLAPA